jgi:aspartate aminotransferase
MRLAQRLAQITESATLEVSRRASELASAGVDVVDLGAGEPDFPSPICAVEAAREALAAGFTRYTPAAGIPDLRRGLAERFQRQHDAPWEAQQVAITVGAKAALFQLALALFEPGDEVVLPTPWWVSFPEQIRLTGAEVVPVSLAAAEGFAIRSEAVLAALSPRTRAILLNSPSNPTGGVVEPAELESIVEAAASRGLLVISDETYERFVYDGRGHASVAALAARFPETVVLVGSFSKTYAMTGWRIGYVVGPPEVIEGVLRIQGHATSNPTSFAMKGALAALEGAEDDVEHMLAEYRQRRDLVVAGLGRLPGVRCQPPAGAFYAFPDVSSCFRDGLRGSVPFASMLLEEARVAVVPGIAFGDDAHIRISFACSRERLAEGLERIETALARLSDSA